MRASTFISWCSVALFAACGGSVDGTGGASTTTTTTTTSTTSATGGKGGSGGEDTGGLPKGKCRSVTDCTVGLETCVPPGASKGCGACVSPPSACASDADCAAMGPTSICEPVPCACSEEKACTPGCTSSATCGVAETCEADHRCHPSICAQQIDCPVNFLCPPILNSRCQRRPCTVDPECDKGYCVEGACYDVPGDCTPPVP